MHLAPLYQRDFLGISLKYSDAVGETSRGSPFQALPVLLYDPFLDLS